MRSKVRYSVKEDLTIPTFTDRYGIYALTISARTPTNGIVSEYFMVHQLSFKAFL